MNRSQETEFYLWVPFSPWGKLKLRGVGNLGFQIRVLCRVRMLCRFGTDFRRQVRFCRRSLQLVTVGSVLISDLESTRGFRSVCYLVNLCNSVCRVTLRSGLSGPISSQSHRTLSRNRIVTRHTNVRKLHQMPYIDTKFYVDSDSELRNV